MAVTIRLAVCWRCRRLLVVGAPPAVFGTCIVCAEYEARVRKQKELAAARRKRRRPARTPEELRASGDPFAKLLGEE